MLHFMEQLVDHGLLVMNTTAAVIYHRLKRQRTAFLIDQFEHSVFWRDDNLKSVIDTGHRQGAQVPRMEHGEDTYYPAYCPIALALARIMHHAGLFCTSGELARPDVPSGWIGVGPLAVQRVWY